MEAKIVYILSKNELDKKVSNEEVFQFVNNNRSILDINDLKNSCFDVFGNIDGTLLTDKLFDSTREFDVFISYSSADIQYANKLAIYLKREMNLECFVDSIYWETMHEMMKVINDKFSNQVYNQNISKQIFRNFDHTRMAVASSLIKVLSKCKYFVFIESGNSILETDKIKALKKQTDSPWINFEINYANILCPPPLQHSLDEQFDITYDLDLADYKIAYNLTELKRNIDFFESSFSGSLEGLYGNK